MIRRGWMAVLVLFALAAGGAAQQYNQSLFSGMKWREVGPFRGGRVLAVEGIPGDPSTYYFGAVAGGVWKSVDGGGHWTPLFDHESVSSIGALAVAPSNHSVIYVGTGEACIRGNISFGDGVYKTTDGGKTWTNLGLKDTRHIGAVIVHPRDPDIVFVAALGHAYGPNPERGLYRTTDGGKSWQKVLSKDDHTGAIDVVFDPTNPNVLFAALWQAQRTPWSLSSGGPGSGLYKSVDGGSTWKKIEGKGWPEGILGRIGVSVSAANPDRVYALVEASEGGLYRSDDGGESWARVNDDERYRQRAWYFTHVWADPKNPDTVYIANTGLFRSTDGGKSFSLLPAPHGDHHALWIDPTNPQRMINGNDGGATITLDGGKTWTSQENQPTAQFYHVATDNRFPYWIYGAQQDNSTIAIASYDDEGVIGRWDWYDVAGGESGYIAPDPRDANVVYAGGNAGFISRFDKRAMQAQDISVVPLDNSGHGVGDYPHRFNWTEPIFVSPHDPNVLYTAGEQVYKSTDQGMSWSAISPDLTRNDKSKQGASGGPITKDNTSVEYYDVVFALAESPVAKDLLWAGTDDGLVQLSRDGGKTWTNVTPKGIPEWSLVSIIEASPFDAGTAYVAVDLHKLDNLHPLIYRTQDFGKTWTEITKGIPDDAYTHAVREDPKRKGLLYAGTEQGVYVSFDDGGQWQPLQLNLPRTPIHDLVIKDDDLVVATHGRSFWVLDDVEPLRQLSAEMAKQDVIFYRPAASYRLQWPGEVPRRQPVGENPPQGAVFDYFLKDKPKDAVTLEIFDSQGKLVRKYVSKQEKKTEEQPPEWPDQTKPPELIPAEAGMNRFAWDQHFQDPVQVPGAFYAGNPPQGPRALPGTYQVKLTVAGKSTTQPLEIKLDPRSKVSQADLEKQLELGLKLRARNSDLHNAVNQIRELRAQLKALEYRLGDDPKAKEVVAAAKALDAKMTPVEEQLIQTKMKSSEGNLNYPTMLNEQFYTLTFSVGLADAAPAQQQYEVYEMLSRQLDGQLAKWKAIVSEDVPALNELMKKNNVPAVEVSPAASE